MRRALPVVVALLAVVSGLVWWNSNSSTLEPSVRHTRVEIGDAAIVADIADTDSLREQGLSHRAGLRENEGMLFIFQEDAMHSFWMKDMLFSIDMIWISADKKVVYIVANAAPETYPSSFVPTEPARYVLEVPAGFAARHGISVGSIATF